MRPDRPIAIAIILFIILLLIFFLVWPEYKNFRKLRADLGEKKALYNAEKEYYAEITKKYFELQNRQDDLKKIDNALPEGPNFGKLVYYFQKTASDSGMLVKDLFLSNKSAALAGGSKGNLDNVKELVFSMDVIGSYSSLQRFLVYLERTDRIFEVASISFGAISSSSVLDIKQIYNFNLQIKTHSY